MFINFENENEKNKEIMGEKVYVNKIYFIHFNAGNDGKWVHALIDDVNDEAITFRAFTDGPHTKVKITDILDIKEKVDFFDSDTLKALYRGETYFDSSKKTVYEWK